VFSYPLPPQPEAVYSLRLINLSYAGPQMQIRRKFDNQSAELYFNEKAAIRYLSVVDQFNVSVNLTDKNDIRLWLNDSQDEALAEMWFDQTGKQNHLRSIN